MRRARRLLATLATLLGLAAGLDARAQQPSGQPGTGATPRRIQPRDLPSVLTADELARLGQRLASAALPVRVVEPLPRGSHPATLEASGVATRVRVEGATLLVVPYSLVSRATEVRVWVEGAWVVATVLHGSILHDLAALRLPEAIAPGRAAAPGRADEVEGLDIAPEPSADPVMVLAAPIDENAEPQAFAVGAGAPLQPELAYYARVETGARNGYPLMTRQGQLAGITTVPTPDGSGGMLMIPAARILEWKANWQSLERGTPGVFIPRVVEEKLDIRVGREALGR